MKKLVICLLTLMLLFTTYGCKNNTSEEGLTVTYFNVGKADAILLQTDGKNVLIDTGEEDMAESLISQLKGLGVETIDDLIITHFDKDHVGGAAGILNNFTVEKIYQSNYIKASDEYEAYVRALGDREVITVFNANIRFKIGDAAFTINGPAEVEYVDDPSNNSSLITIVKYGDNTLLFMGDAENARMEEFVSSLNKTVENVILKVPHHGNYDKQLKQVIKYYVPAVSIITCSTTEPEAEDLEKTVNALQNVSSEIYYAYNGNITISLNKTGYSVRQ